MKALKIVGGIVSVALIAVVFLAPIGPLPGFFIGGEATPAPSTWPDTSNVHEIELKVPGTLPRVVVIWLIQHAEEIYVVGARSSGWVQMIGQGAPVAMKLDGKTYDLKAEPVNEGWEPIMQSYIAKYEPDYPEIVAGFPSIDEAKGTIGVFKLAR